MTGKVALRAGVTAVALALIVPLWVLVAGLVGLQPTHWSGTRMGSFEVPPFTKRIHAAPEPARMLLSTARDQAERSDDFAPSYWDADARQVVLGATTEAGVAQRRSLGEASGTAYRVERRPHSSRKLQTIQDEIRDWIGEGVLVSSVDSEHDRVVFTTTRLSHGFFVSVASRYGDAAEITYAPTMPAASTLELVIGAPARPVAENRTDPLGSWFTLATGFPWYLGTALAAGTAVWFVPRLRRRRATSPTAQSLHDQYTDLRTD
jgi:hypothetical protein